jgi:hypothetical protein
MRFGWVRGKRKDNAGTKSAERRGRGDLNTEFAKGHRGHGEEYPKSAGRNACATRAKQEDGATKPRETQERPGPSADSE